MGLRRVTHDDLKYVVTSGDLIEEYPNDKPYPKALFMAYIQNEQLLRFLRFLRATVLLS
jgi:hypothetical protein